MIEINQLTPLTMCVPFNSIVELVLEEDLGTSRLTHTYTAVSSIFDTILGNKMQGREREIGQLSENLV